MTRARFVTAALQEGAEPRAVPAPRLHKVPLSDTRGLRHARHASHGIAALALALAGREIQPADLLEGVLVWGESEHRGEALVAPWDAGSAERRPGQALANSRARATDDAALFAGLDGSLLHHLDRWFDRGWEVSRRV